MSDENTMIDPTDENDFRSTYEAAMASLRRDGHYPERSDEGYATAGLPTNDERRAPTRR